VNEDTMLIVQRFISNEDAATAVEYGLITALIAVGLIAAFVVFGGALLSMFEYVRDQAGNSMTGANV
jgi:pilus assembly protein Flp/PilA